MSNVFRRELRGNTMIFWNTNVARRCALTPEYSAGLREVLADVAEDPAVAAVVLASEGDFFCAGGDLNSIKERRDISVEERFQNIDRLHSAIRAIRSCPKPVISAVEGGAAGAGVSISLACDMVVSAREAKFTLSYVRAGLVPDGGATYTLMKILPRATVSRLAMMAKSIQAERLYDVGGITELCAPGEALDGALSLAESLAKGPEQAIASIKTLLNKAESASLEAHLDTECAAMAEAMGGEEAQIGINAFLNKQTPVFRN